MDNKIFNCVFEYDSKEYWAIYHPDDGGIKLVFSSNIEDMDKIESFININVENIIGHMNKYGFEVEPSKKFGDVIYFKNIPSGASIKLIEKIN